MLHKRGIEPKRGSGKKYEVFPDGVTERSEDKRAEALLGGSETTDVKFPRGRTNAIFGKREENMKLIVLTSLLVLGIIALITLLLAITFYGKLEVNSVLSPLVSTSSLSHTPTQTGNGDEFGNTSAPRMFVQPGFRGPTGQPHINGPTTPPPDY